MDNVFQAQEIKDKINSDDIWLKKYNCTKKEFFSGILKERWKKMSANERAEFINKTWGKNAYSYVNGIFSSKLEEKVFTYLKKLNYENIKRQLCLCTTEKNIFL